MRAHLKRRQKGQRVSRPSARQPRASSSPQMATSRSTTSHQLYHEVPLPPGTWWKNESAAKEYKASKKALQVASRSQNLDTVVAHIKTRQHKLLSRKNHFDISILLAFGLGVTMATGITLVAQMGTLVDLGLFLILLSFFHMWEYCYVSYFHAETLSFECTLQSKNLLLTRVRNLIKS